MSPSLGSDPTSKIQLTQDAVTAPAITKKVVYFEADDNKSSSGHDIDRTRIGIPFSVDNNRSMKFQLLFNRGLCAQLGA